MAERVDRHMRAAVGDLLHGLDDVRRLRCVDRRDRADFLREIELFVGQVDGDDIGAHGARDHDRRQADAAAAVHGDPFAGCDAALVDDGAEGCDEAAAQTRGGGEVHLLGELHEIRVGEVERDIFGEGAPGGEARLELIFADLVVAGDAFEAMAAAGNEGHGDAVALLPAGHAAADRGNPAGELVAGDVRQADVGIVSHPAVPVAAAEPSRLDLDYDAFRRGRRVWNVADGGRLAKRFKNNGFHRLLRFNLVVARPQRALGLCSTALIRPTVFARAAARWPSRMIGCSPVGFL